MLSFYFRNIPDRETAGFYADACGFRVKRETGRRTTHGMRAESMWQSAVDTLVMALGRRDEIGDAIRCISADEGCNLARTPFIKAASLPRQIQGYPPLPASPATTWRTERAATARPPPATRATGTERRRSSLAQIAISHISRTHLGYVRGHLARRGSGVVRVGSNGPPDVIIGAGGLTSPPPPSSVPAFSSPGETRFSLTGCPPRPDSRRRLGLSAPRFPPEIYDIAENHFRETAPARDVLPMTRIASESPRLLLRTCRYSKVYSSYFPSLPSPSPRPVTTV
ncbi:hypothetical protein PUN28_006611 [Cardiocondyla obscurior]|uniref:Uncharacterized protein n=1 Tax=Cardiocondyla obscurior TaxID=286306 RepID=A0AAW2GB79_9HYME